MAIGDHEWVTKGFFQGHAFSYASLRSVHVTVIRKINHDGVVSKMIRLNGLKNTTNIPVEVFNHRIITHEVFARMILNALYGWHIGAQLNIFGFVMFDIFWRCDIRIVRRLHGANGEEWIFIYLILEIVDEKVGEGVGFTDREFVAFDWIAQWIVAVDIKIVLALLFS